MKTGRSIVVALMLAGAAAVEARAQLAITEVMAAPSRDDLPDYWELTNFSDGELNLQGYGFHDSDPATFATNMFDGLVIRGGESVIFVRTNANTYMRTIDDFKKWWWGEDNLPTNLQVRFFARGGLDGDNGESISVLDSRHLPVHTVAFDKSFVGRSFTYSPENGEFGIPSVPEIGCAFRAATATNDVGSPGCTTGPAPLFIHVEPTSQSVDVCGRAVFSIVASAMPPPRYQWTLNGMVIPGETASTLVIPQVDLSHGGAYRVVLDNGLTNFVTAPAFLTVTTNSTQPRIVRAPEDIVVFPGQNWLFELETHGYPCPQYQWRSNDVAITGATNRTLSVFIPADASESIHRYSVTAWNEVGSTSTSAILRVSRRPRLVLTEIMAFPTNGFELGHLNWFELTNYDTNSVSLQGYRFKDSTSLSVASKVTNAVSIRPGESVVFVEAMSAGEFKQWWGRANLPPDLQVITWGGWGLSTRGSTDLINVWNPAAIDEGDKVADEGRLDARPGVSQIRELSSLEEICDPTYGCSSSFLFFSIEGERGAFRAAVGGDIGSPGYAAFPRFLGISKAGPSISIRVLIEPGKSYRLLASEDLSGAPWVTVDTLPVGNSWISTRMDIWEDDLQFRFYLLEEELP